MRVREGKGRLPGSRHQQRANPHRPRQSRRSETVATETRNPQTSAIDVGNPRIPKTFHPGLCPHRPTSHQPFEERDQLPMDGRIHPSHKKTNRHNTQLPHPEPTHPLPPPPPETIHPRSRRIRVRHRSNTVPGTRRDEAKKASRIPLPNVQPRRTELRYLRPRVPSHHPRPRKLETPPRGKPPPSTRPHGPQQPPVLATPTTNQPTHCPIPLTTGGLRRPPKTPARKNKQSRPPLPTTGLRPRNRRQPR